MEAGDIALSVRTGSSTKNRKKLQRTNSKVGMNAESHHFLKDKSRLKSIKLATSLSNDHKIIKNDEHHHDSNHVDSMMARHEIGAITEQKGGGTFGSRAVGGHKPKDKTVYDSIESIDYLVPDTVEESLMARIMTDHKKACCGGTCCNRAGIRRSVMWCLYIFIGASVSLLITGVLALTGLILDLRVDATKILLDDGNIGLAWLSWTGSSLILCLFAVTMVLIEPAAASSGIPGLIAFLNGVEPHGGTSPITGKKTSFTSWETMLAKTLGMIASVPAGLCIGPEGPIIHVSALMAHWTCIVVQWLEQWAFPTHRFTAYASEARDFMATGAACGICTAFRAPLAGVMFVVEEASTFFTTTHLEYTFLATLTAYWVTWAFIASGEGSSTVKFKQTTGNFCTYHDVIDFLIFACVGIVGGCIGALFNQIVEHLNHLRVHHVNKSGVKRVLEVVVICLLTGTASVYLPAAFECKSEVRTIMMQDSAGCLNDADRFQISHGAISHPYLVTLLKTAQKSGNCTATTSTTSGGGSSRMLLASDSSSSSSSSSSALLPNINNILKELEEHRHESSGSGSTSGSGGSKTPVDDDVVWVDNLKPYIHLHYSHRHTCNKDNHEYNEMSMLWLNGGVKAVKVLLQRGFPHMLSATCLIVFFLVYFVLASITAGISVPAGLVVPMLLIGSSYGRLFGLGALEFKKSLCSSDYPTSSDSLAFSNSYYYSTYTRWMVRSCRMPDPGTFAIVGAASFLGGSGRITVMLATVLLELTDDASMIAPVGIVCVLAMLVGNAFNHGLYHGLIPVFDIPFLNTSPPPEARLACAADVMATGVVVVPKFCHMTQLEALLEKCVLSDADRTHKDAISHHAFPVVESNKVNKCIGLVTRHQLECALVAAKEDHQHTLQFINIMKYADRSPLTVFPNTRLSRAYTVFQKLGMRHLPVCNTSGEIVGILTRKNLMHYLLTDQKNVELMKIREVQRGARNYLKSRKIKSDKLFDQFSIEQQHYLSNDEMEKAVTHHLTNTLLIKFDEKDEEHTMDHVIQYIHEHKKKLNWPHIQKKEFDLLLAEARRYDIKKRRAKEIEKSGGVDHSLDQAIKHYEDHLKRSDTKNLVKELEKTRKVKKRVVEVSGQKNILLSRSKENDKSDESKEEKVESKEEKVEHKQPSSE